MDILKSKFNQTSSNVCPNNILKELPVSIPLKNIEDLENLETYLNNHEHCNNLIAFCSGLSSLKEIVPKVNRILRNMLTDKLAAEFNYCGQNNKRSFSKLTICRVVINAAKFGADASVQQIENAIKNWLKHAPKRNAIKNKCDSE